MAKIREKVLSQLPELYKQGDDGKVLVWNIKVVEPSDIVVSYGQQGGKMIEQREHIASGKNEGKKNATTPAQQALLASQARWTKQVKRKQYAEVLELAKVKRATYPMLAYAYSKHAAKVRWDTACAQPKLDGYRCLARLAPDGKSVDLRSREGLPVKTMPHIEAELAPLLRKHPEMTLDGELYSHGMPLQKISSAVKKRSALSEEIGYHTYDTVADDSFTSRYDELRSRLSDFSMVAVSLVKTVKVRSQDELLTFQQRMLEGGYEGSILRHSTLGYQAGKRSSCLLKFKEFQEDDFQIEDVKEGRGTHEGAAIFICRTEAGHNFDVLAPGTLEEKKNAWANWENYIGKWCVVKFFNYTASAESVPFHGVAIKVRNKKGLD